MVKTGLDRIAEDQFNDLRGSRFGVICNQASIDRNCRHILDLLARSSLSPRAVFGPQHGLYGHTQDNMIEWEGGSGPNYPIYSLYGESREPSDAMLDGLDLLVVDLQDVGARYYTFIWTLALCLKACQRRGIRVLVLDRPNPIGRQQEGPVQEPGYESFVGLHPLPMRHGLTIGEIALALRGRYYPQCLLEVVQTEGWQGGYWDATGLPWGMPSPNMPTLETAIVYPGGCLLEATNISEGRGTTRPFEIVGAPWLDKFKFCEELNSLQLPGVYFRPLEFQPSFNKYVGEVCQGAFVHVVDRITFQPVLTYISIIGACQGESFAWKQPPYEYEYEKLPIDILAGGPWLRDGMRLGRCLGEWVEMLKRDDEFRF